MKGKILTLALLGAVAGAARAQCPITITKSGTGMSRTYTASSPASGMAYTWSQGGYPNTSGTSISRTYSYGGYYYVGLEGSKTAPVCHDSTSIVDTVLGAIDCASTYAYVIANGSGSTRSFYAYSYNGTTGGSAVPPGYSLAVSYSYGDGTSGTSASHTYASNGTYTVTATFNLTSATYASCTKTATTTVYISGIVPAGCGTSISKSGTGMTRTYTAVHPNYPTASWNHTWQTSPGGFSNASGASVTRTFTYGGTYYTSLTASLTSPVVCNDSALYVVDTVFGPMDCSSTYLVLGSAYGSGNTRTFYPSVSANKAPTYSVTLNYNYGDGTTGTSSTHTYASNGTYTVTLTATWADATNTYASCTKTSTSTLTISGSPSTICNTAVTDLNVSGNGPSFTFTNASTPATMPSGVGVTYNLYYGDSYYFGGFSANSSIQHAYTQNGTYKALLTATYYATTYPYQTICTKRDSIFVTVTNAPNKIEAQVSWDSTTAPDSNTAVKFWLIQYDSTTQMLTAIDSAVSVNGWAWYRKATFNNVPNGLYRLKAHMLNQPATATSGFLPTYYSNSLNWNTATVVSCSNCGTSSYFWQLQQGTPVTGPGFIGGSVLAGANKGTAAGDPIANQLVLLRDANGKTIRSVSTDAQGGYRFQNLPIGTYTVYPEEMNYTTTASDVVSITGFQSMASGYNFRKSESSHTISPFRTTSVGNTPVAQGIRIHPNPTTGLITVQLPAAGADVTVRITTVTGQEVHTRKVPAARAAKGWEMDLSNLPAGYYNLVLETAEGRQAEKLLLQR